VDNSLTHDPVNFVPYQDATGVNQIGS